MPQDPIERALREHLSVAEACLALAPEIRRASDAIVASLQTGNKLLFCGNGGSAADAQHLAAEFTGRFLVDRDPLPAIALHANSSSLTAIGNDYGFEQVFVRPLRAFGRRGDVLVAISTSGGSANVIAAAAAARELGIGVIAMTGAGGGALADVADVTIRIPSASTPNIQEMHIVIGHILCGIAEEAMC